MKRYFSLMSVFLLGMVFVSHASMVLQLNLEQLTALSTRVFVGKCVSVKNETDADGRFVQDITHQVKEMLKGEPSETITFRQLAPTLSHGLPSYQVGEENIIFLGDDSRIGLNAPTGLLQGKFRVESASGGGEGGEKQVVNGTGNKGLFLHWEKSPRYKSLSLSTRQKQILQKKAGSVPYEDFVSLVKSLSQE